MASGNDYVIEVKGNQPKLAEKLKEASRSMCCIDEDVQQDNKRGRKVTRTIRMYDVEKHFQDTEWKKVRTLLKVERKGVRKEKGVLKPFREDHYYISSIKGKSARYFADGIRSHWGIENKLHWVKDVVTKEDHSGIKTPEIACNMSLFRSVVINIYRLKGLKSITYAIEKYANKVKETLAFIEIDHICKI